MKSVYSWRDIGKKWEKNIELSDDVIGEKTLFYYFTLLEVENGVTLSALGPYLLRKILESLHDL